MLASVGLLNNLNKVIIWIIMKTDCWYVIWCGEYLGVLSTVAILKVWLLAGYVLVLEYFISPKDEWNSSTQKHDSIIHIEVDVSGSAWLSRLRLWSWLPTCLEITDCQEYRPVRLTCLKITHCQKYHPVRLTCLEVRDRHMISAHYCY